MKRLLPRLALLLAAAGLSAGCPGTLDDPDRFREGGSSTCPPGTNVETDILAATTGANGCASKICHDADTPEGNLDLASPGVASRLLDKVSASKDCSGKTLVDSTNPEASLLLEKVSSGAPSCGDPMPLTGKLSAAEVDCIRQYVLQLAGGGAAGAGGAPTDSGAD